MNSLHSSVSRDTPTARDDVIGRLRAGARLASVVLCAGMAGCSSTAGPAPSGQGEPTWRATTTACATPGVIGTCNVPGWTGRPYRVFIPSRAVVSAPQPIVLMFHGGGGNATGTLSITCPPNAVNQPDLTSPSCLQQLAEREGFVLVAPNGTGTAGDPEFRTFNAGGGQGQWQCVSGLACTTGVNDEGYVRAVLDHLNGWINVDGRATFATGLSNGGALAHRLACTLSTRIVAIATVGGLNQFAATAPCQPERPVAILQIHGSADPCWTYEESDRACLAVGSGRKVGVEASAAGWASRLGCAATPMVVREPDRNGDRLQTVSSTWRDCRAAVVSLRVEGGGHTWPNGFQYSPEAAIGPVSREWGSERIWAFFTANRR
jgi:polyhydroxybutyrate depolymerase